MYQLMGLGSGNNQVVNRYHEFVQASSGNSGNLLFNYALEQIVDLAPGRYKWSTPSAAINEAGNNLLIPMANNIGAHTDISLSGPKIDNVDVKAVVMGIGAQFTLSDDISEAAQKVPAGTKLWLEKISRMSDQINISVRGATTKAFFEEIGLGDKVIALGCPSHLISHDISLGQTLRKRVRWISKASLVAGIGVTAGNPYLTNLAPLEKFLIGLMNQYGGAYIVQNPKSLICLAEGWLDSLEQSELCQIRKNWFPDQSEEQMNTWMRRYSRTYVSIPQWFRDISKHELVVGTRIHGCQLGIQAGVPSVCTYIDSRTKELCDTMMLPSIDARELQKDPSEERLFGVLENWDWDAFDENRQRLAKKTIEFLLNNGVKPSSHLVKFTR